jgi:peptidoglycan/xylan/chitin deacetylase (PgdA/CDA1 family)
MLEKVAQVTKNVISRGLQKRALVLNYHRVNELGPADNHLVVTAENFREHVRLLAQKYRSVPLSKVLDEETLSWRNGWKMPVAITFDDGYADLLTNALPVLEEFKFPATIFITTSMIGSSGEFWWDELEHILFDGAPKTRQFKLTEGGKEHVWPLENESQIQTFYRELIAIVRNSEEPKRREIMDKVRAWAGTKASGRDTFRAVNWDELGKIARHPLIEVGSHTVTHPNLGKIGKEAQTREMRTSKEVLDKVLPYPSKTIAYPFGDHGDFDEDTFVAAKDCGYEMGLTTVRGPIVKDTPRYAMPRLFVKNWDASTLDRMMIRCSLFGEIPTV